MNINKLKSSHYLFPLLFVVILNLQTASASSIQNNKKVILPSDVFFLLSQFRAEVDILRAYMGKPKVKPNLLNVKSASPREVYYQALTLFEKSNQFSFDQIRERRTVPEKPNEKIKPKDVYHVINKALHRILDVKKKLKISKAIQPPQFIHNQTPSGVYSSISVLNRQLNLLLDQPFAPKEVFKQVSFAIGYSARLLETFPNTVRIPKAEKLTFGKLPIDVYSRLQLIYKDIKIIGRISNIEMLDFEINSPHIEPSDVYDLASLIVSELAYMHTKLLETRPPRRVFDPGRKTPSQVYQRVSILESQIMALQLEITESPLWITHFPEAQ